MMKSGYITIRDEKIIGTITDTENGKHVVLDSPEALETYLEVYGPAKCSSLIDFPEDYGVNQGFLNYVMGGVIS